MSLRILVLVPSPQHKATAGTRIRYERLNVSGEAFAVTVQSLEELLPAELDDCDVVLFSKTYTVAAIALARELRRRGRIVGVDLFDDYFSAAHDARLTRFRAWLGRFADAFDFALCSTGTMRRVIGTIAPDLPVLIVPDAYPEIEAEALAATLAAKRARVLETGVLDVVWFGAGSNPFFPVGLHDLTAFAWSLDALARASRRFALHLTILTDEAAQTTRSLARLRRLSIEHRVETWSLEAETQALERALVAFIPVNGQGFSRAKSLNRALTAVSSGTQVLSPGFPLYRDLGDAVYDDGAAIVPDLVADRLRLRPANVEAIAARAAAVSSLSAVMSDLYVFLVMQVRAKARQSARAEGPAPRQALIFGHDVDRKMLAAVASAGVLTVRAPFTSQERVFDVRLDHRGGRELDIWVKPDHVGLLAEPLRGRCAPPERVGKVQMRRVQAGALGLLDRPPPIRLGEERGLLYETQAYAGALADVEGVCARLFPGLEFLTSDIRAYMRPASDDSAALAS